MSLGGDVSTNCSIVSSMVGALIGVRGIPREDILNKVIQDKDISEADDDLDQNNKKPKSKRAKMTWLNLKNKGVSNI